MLVDRLKLHELIHHPSGRPGAEELRREENIFFIGGDLDPQETLATVFESHSQQPAELVLLTFGGIDTFHRGEEHARILKKNFHLHLLARFDYPVPRHLLERAYAAGIDLVDIPLTIFDSGLARERALHKDQRLAALETALAIFPDGGVAATLTVGEEACCSTVSGIDALLKAGVVPLPELSSRAAHYPLHEIEEVFLHLAQGLKKHKVVTKPLLPLLSAVAPLAPAKRRGILKGFIDRLHDRRLLAASDFRRSLRVRQVEESFESSGL